MFKHRKRASIILLTMVGIFLAINTVMSQGRFVARAIVIGDDVHLLRDGTDEWVALGMESIVGEGDRLRTSATGSLRIETVDGATSLQVEPNSELLLNQLDMNNGEPTIALTLANGAMSGRLASNDGMTIFEVTLPGLTFYTRASDVNTWITDDDYANVISNSGTLYILRGEEFIELSSGNGVSASKTGMLGRISPSNNRDELTLLRQGISAEFSVSSDIQLNVRRGPSLSAPLMGTILPSAIDRVYATDQTSTWYRIDYNNGYAWVSAQDVETTIATGVLLAQFPTTFTEPNASEVHDQALAAEAPAEDAPYRPAVMDYMNAEEMEVLAELNAWRVSIGLAGFMPNETLTEMAHFQAEYLATLPSLQDVNIHADAQGRDEDGRGRDPMFGWPYYANDQRIALGENGAIGNGGTQFAINYWRNSEIHRNTAQNPAYREIGIAVVPSQFGRIYITVFGARPNVFPVLYDTVNNQLVLHNEEYRFADPGDWITSIDRVQIVGSGFAQLEDDQWQSFQRRIDVPDMTEFAVTFDGAGKQVALPVDLRENILWLPENLPSDDGVIPVNIEVEEAPPAAPTIPPVDNASLGTPIVQSVETTPQPATVATEAPVQQQSFGFPTNTPVGG